MKAAFLGPKGYNQIFSFLGFDCFAISNNKQAMEKIKELKENGFDLIFASKDVLEKEIEDVIILSGITKKAEDSYIEKEIQKAIGSKISLK